MSAAPALPSASIPREPTEAMIEAGLKYHGTASPAIAWRAMWDAAPALPPVDVEALVERLRVVCPDTTEDAVIVMEAATELTRLRSMCDELAGAVEPFANEAEWMGEGYPDSASPDRSMSLTYADYRRARTAYAKYQQEQGR